MEGTKEEIIKDFNEWLAESPDIIKEMGTKYPAYKSWRMKKDAPYAISCGGTRVILNGYIENGKVSAVVLAKEKLPAALEHEKKLCEEYGKNFEEAKLANVLVEVDPIWLEEIPGEDPDFSTFKFVDEEEGHHHEDGVKCEACESGMEAVHAKEKALIEKNGWYAHFVMNDPLYPFNTNVHTHGLKEKFDHSDIQICFPINPEIIDGLLWDVVEKIKGGEKFEAGKEYKGIISQFAVRFVNATEGDRVVLRMVFPDQTGKFDTEPFSKQIPVIN